MTDIEEMERATLRKIRRRDIIQAKRVASSKLRILFYDLWLGFACKELIERGTPPEVASYLIK